MDDFPDELPATPVEPLVRPELSTSDGLHPHLQPQLQHESLKIDLFFIVKSANIRILLSVIVSYFLYFLISKDL